MKIHQILTGLAPLLIFVKALPNTPGPAGRACPVPQAGECMKPMTADGKKTIYSYANCGQLFCDTAADGGGWIIFQRRTFKDVYFNKTWNEFKTGFGTYCTDFWLGLETISQMTNQNDYQMRIDLQKGSNINYALYNTFKVAPASQKYKLTIGDYSGNAGNDFISHNNAMFSTKDMDNDGSVDDNCAQFFNAGWWFTDCFSDNLNGDFLNSDWGMGVIWAPLMPDLEGSLDWVEMKMRKK